MSRLFIVTLLLVTLILSSMSVQISAQAEDPPPPFQEGDVFAGVGNGLVKRFQPDGTLIQTLDTTSGSVYQTGMCFDSVGNLYTTNFDAQTMSKFNNSGSLLIHPWGGPFGIRPESCVLDADGNIYTGEVDGDELIRKWDPDGNLLATFDAATEYRGIDWLDLAADQCTLYYTSEGSSIKRYDVCNDTQLSDFATGLTRPCFSLRLRPNGEVLVACREQVYRLNNQGGAIQTYDPGDGSEYLFAMNLDPDGTTFWTGGYNSGNIYRIDIESGDELTSFNVGVASGSALAGISVVGEIGANLVDSDGDGLFDIWETQGLDSDGDGNIDIDLPAMGADPDKKDIFVEVDWMSNDDHSHQPNPAAIEEIVNSFANSPVDGVGINLHVDAGPDSVDYVTGQTWGDLAGGNSLSHQDILGVGGNQSLADDLNDIINNNFDTARSQVFHYSIFAHKWANNGNTTCSSGFSLGNGYQVFVVAMGCWEDEVGSFNEQAGTFMHELGHNLGLDHGGGDGINHKPNYLSIMNYSFQMGGLVINGTDEHYDYSRFDLPDLDESQLSEPNGLNGSSEIDNYGTKFHITFPFLCVPDSLNLLSFTVAETANGPVNWDCNIGVDQDPVQEDANDDGEISTLHSHDDWTNLDYTAGGIGSAGAPPVIVITTEALQQIPDEITPEQDELIQRVSKDLYLPIIMNATN